MHRSQKTLKRFFVVTTVPGSDNVSLYRILNQCLPKTSNPYIRKLALRGKSNVVTGEYFHYGSHVGITKKWGIEIYNPEKWIGGRPQPSCLCSTAYRGVHTSPIVGLFVDEAEARECFASEGLQSWDPRWQEASTKVLQLIGDNHPLFILDNKLYEEIGGVVIPGTARH